MKREPKIDNTSTNPAPSMEWKLIAETLDELRGVSPLQRVLAYFPHTKHTAVVEAGAAVEYHAHDTWGGAAWMPLPAPPKPDPTIAELERAVVEAVDAMKRHGVYAKGSLEDVLITRHDALAAYRAAEGGV